MPHAEKRNQAKRCSGKVFINGFPVDLINKFFVNVGIQAVIMNFINKVEMQVMVNKNSRQISIVPVSVGFYDVAPPPSTPVQIGTYPDKNNGRE